MTLKVEKKSWTWTLGLKLKAKRHRVEKVKQHARDSLQAIRKLSENVPLCKNMTFNRFDAGQCMVKALNSGRTRTLTGRQNPRVSEGVKELAPASKGHFRRTQSNLRRETLCVAVSSVPVPDVHDGHSRGRDHT